MSTATIELTSKYDRWRFVCPRGHRSWEPTNHHFWCQRCARSNDDSVDPTFDELRDRKSDRLVAREEIKLLTPEGPFDADLDGVDTDRTAP